MRSLLSVTVRFCTGVEHADDGPGAPICQDVLGYVLALIPMSTRVRSFKRLLDEANVDPSWLSETFMSQDEDDPIYKLPFGLIGFGDSNTALLVTSFVMCPLCPLDHDSRAPFHIVLRAHPSCEFLMSCLDIRTTCPDRSTSLLAICHTH